MQSTNMMSSGSQGTASYLMDAYPGATAAYSSARILKSGVSYPFKARRFSDLSLRDIGHVSGITNTADLASWGGSQATVQTLYNQMGTSTFDLINNNDSTSPRVINGGSLQLINGRLCMFFNGLLLTSSGAMSLIGNLTTSIFIVYRKDSTSAGCVFGWGNISFALGVFGIYDDGAAGNAEIAFAGGNSKMFTTPPNLNTYIHTIIKTPGAINTTTNVYRNGASVAIAGGSSSTPNVAGGTSLQLGQLAGYASNKLNGYILEMIIYPSDQSANRTAIEANIASFYGL